MTAGRPGVRLRKRGAEMKYVLIVILLTSNNNATTVTVEFDSLAACQLAEIGFTLDPDRSSGGAKLSDKFAHIWTYCLPKNSK